MEPDDVKAILCTLFLGSRRYLLSLKYDDFLISFSLHLSNFKCDEYFVSFILCACLFSSSVSILSLVLEGSLKYFSR